MNLENSDGYKSLMTAYEKSVEMGGSSKDELFKKVTWALERAKHYAEKTGLEAADILDSWEKDRTYWYMNYYQEANQPEIKSGKVFVFDTVEELRKSIDGKGFRCPSCKGVSSDPYECDTGLFLDEKKVCDWKSYGVFGCLNSGVTVFVKEKLRVQTFFTPIAWGKEE